MGPYGVPGTLSMGPYGYPGSRDSWTRGLGTRGLGTRDLGSRDKAQTFLPRYPQIFYPRIPRFAANAAVGVPRAECLRARAIN